MYSILSCITHALHIHCYTGTKQIAIHYSQISKTFAACYAHYTEVPNIRVKEEHKGQMYTQFVEILDKFMEQPGCTHTVLH